MEQKKKKIVIIDQFEPTLLSISHALKEKKFEVFACYSLEEAIPIIEREEIDYIVSDLIFHQNLAGVEFLVENIVEKKKKFAFWLSHSEDISGSLESLGLLQDGMPKDFILSYDESKALDQEQIDILVENFRTKKKSSIPLFLKKDGFAGLLKYLFS